MYTMNGTTASHCLLDDDAHRLQMRKAHFHSPFKGLAPFSAETAKHVTAKTCATSEERPRCET